MSKYFFHISGKDPFHDSDGLELPNDDAAWIEAKKLVRDIESDLAPGDDWQLDVVDNSGSVFVMSIKSKHMR
jgi:hypothetical protein